MSADRPTPLEQAPALAEQLVESEGTERAPATRTSRAGQARQRVKPGSLLAERAATEYVYVGHDLRRITVLSLVLTGLMIAAWLAIVVFRVIPLDFY